MKKIERLARKDNKEKAGKKREGYRKAFSYLEGKRAKKIERRVQIKVTLLLYSHMLEEELKGLIPKKNIKKNSHLKKTSEDRLFAHPLRVSVYKGLRVLKVTGGSRTTDRMVRNVCAYC